MQYAYTIYYLNFPVASEIIASVMSTLNFCLGALLFSCSGKKANEFCVIEIKINLSLVFYNTIIN